jgi:hypothetical protein
VSEGPEREAALADERRRVRELRAVVDLTTSVLRQAPLTRKEAVRLADASRKRALELFPDKGSTFDLVIAPRLRRIIDERFGSSRRAHILPFPARPEH